MILLLCVFSFLCVLDDTVISRDGMNKIFCI